jgi:hypothetical protein
MSEVICSLNEHIHIKGNPPYWIVETMELLAKIMPSHAIKVIYSDTFYCIDLNKLYEKIVLYDTFMVVFTMNNDNVHEKDLFNVLCGDCNRLIWYKDIKSIEY